MAKRKRTGFLEDLFDIAALIFIGLHQYAATPAPVTTDVAHAGGMVVTQMFKTLASIGQWLIPLAFLIGAAVIDGRHQPPCKPPPARYATRPWSSAWRAKGRTRASRSGAAAIIPKPSAAARGRLPSAR